MFDNHIHAHTSSTIEHHHNSSRWQHKSRFSSFLFYHVQDSSYQCRKHPDVNMILECYRILTQMVSWVCRNSLALTYPPNIYIWIVYITISMPMDRYFKYHYWCRLLTTRSPIYGFKIGSILHEVRDWRHCVIMEQVPMEQTNILICWAWNDVFIRSS